MMNRRYRILAGIFLLACLGIIWLLNQYGPANPSPEWTYTMRQINRIAVPAMLCVLALLLVWAAFARRKALASGAANILFFLGACLSFAIPLLTTSVYHISWQLQYFLSFCWFFGLLCACLFSFGLATRLTSAWAAFLCLAGSIFFAMSVLEGYLLLTSQPADGISNASSESRYLASGATPEPGAWQGFICGSRYASNGEPQHLAHRIDKFGKPVFDVQYGISPAGWRVLPGQSQSARYDLLLFGCSYTFGHSLEDDQTWPWKLATLLGSDWRIENYSLSGWSINQPLCLLEHDLIERPKGKENFAIFLAIKDHARRTDFYPGTPVYHLDANGEAAAGGKPAYNTLHRIPEILNGSQLARETGGFITRLVMEQPERMNSLYLAMLGKTAAILREKYDTRLIVLIWPDLDELGPRISDLGIPVLYIKAMLPDWDKDPGVYYVSPFDGHPNARAASAIAQGVADYLRKLASTHVPN